MMIIPAIDLKDGHCVRLVQGRKAEVKTYDDEPLSVAHAFASAGAQMLHVVDLDGAFSGAETTNRDVLQRIVEQVKVPVEFGGGLRTVAAAEKAIALGVERVVMGTMAVDAPDDLKTLIDRHGARICVGIDARDGMVMTRGWEAASPLTAISLAQSLVSLGVERIIYTDIARDGMLSGPNINQTVGLAKASGLKVTASGGISCLEDIRRLSEANEPLVDSVIIGKALYESRFTLADAIATART
jgi:phosphoribosylformimino-5-aminoimidazole carboxamide ribotide isomerase